jgi:hypothetical protein
MIGFPEYRHRTSFWGLLPEGLSSQGIFGKEAVFFSTDLFIFIPHQSGIYGAKPRKFLIILLNALSDL